MRTATLPYVRAYTAAPKPLGFQGTKKPSPPEQIVPEAAAVSRRQFLKASGYGSTLSYLSFKSGFAQEAGPSASLSETQKASLLQDVQRLTTKSIDYFIQHRHASGLVLDRAPNTTGAPPTLNPTMASIAATGYGLSALVLGVEKGQVSRQQAEAWTLETLATVAAITPPENKGWMPHFIDINTLKPYGKSEISSIDTVLFLLGALAAGEYFGGAVKQKAQALFDQVDFQAMLTNDGTQPDKRQFSHGFHLEAGQRQFIPWNWNAFSEGILIPLLALGAAPQQNIPESVWTQGWKRDKGWKAFGQETYGPLPLFTHYYPLGYLPLKGKKDSQGEDLWENARKAVEMQRQHCQVKGYPDGLFGISACDGPNGYLAYHPTHPEEDKTIAPPAILASLPFNDKAVYEALQALKKRGLSEDSFGLTCAYNVDSGWKATDALGIDIGSTLLMMDAYQGGLIHKLMSQNAVLQKGLKRAGWVTLQ